MQALSNAGIFLLHIIFGFYILALLVRVILQFVHADYYNPISQIVIKLTNPVVKPVRKFIPGFKGIDLAIVMVAIIITMLKLYLIVLIKTSILPHVLGVFIWSIGMTLEYLINIYFYAILLRALVSWFSPNKYNEFTILLIQITEPMLFPLRKKIKPFRGIDFTPLIALLALQLLSILVSYPIMQLGGSLL